ncbi:hypothetical protein ABZ946_29075 [Streptomyces sp. NPDC046324]|uniref:hypothetical protein n=1 Tax=Streptomyces sp. NPDC046324 TaxID=3154915 RepID=UPI0033D33154
MHATRTTATFLAGAAIAALSGCVSVDPPPAAPPPPLEVSGPSPHVDVAPQIVEGPAREALEAALPAPAPPSPRATPRKPRQQNGTTVRNGTGSPQRQSSTPREKERTKPPRPPGVPEPPRSRADVCRLGAQYGGWHPESVQATICKDAYGR